MPMFPLLMLPTVRTDWDGNSATASPSRKNARGSLCPLPTYSSYSSDAKTYLSWIHGLVDVKLTDSDAASNVVEPLTSAERPAPPAVPFTVVILEFSAQPPPRTPQSTSASGASND